MDIQIIHSHGVPRQIQTGIQIGADDRCFLIAALHPGKAVYLLEQLFLAVLGKVQFPDLVAVIVGLGVGIVPLAQLIVDDVQLLVQIVIALVLVHGLVDLFRDLLFDLHHLTFTAQHLHKALQTAVEGVLVHHGLLVLVAEQEVCRHIFGEEHGVIAGNNGEHNVLGKARVHAQILVKAGLEGAEQRLGLHSFFGLCGTHRSGAHGRQQKIAGGIQLGQLGAVLTLHQHLDQLIRHAQHLLDLGYYAVGVQVLLGRFTGLHLLLGNQKYVGVIGHGPLHGSNAFFPPDFKMNKVVGEHHQPAQCDGGQMEFLPLDLDGNFFRHIQTPPDCRSSSHAAAVLSFGVFFDKNTVVSLLYRFPAKMQLPSRNGRSFGAVFMGVEAHLAQRGQQRPQRDRGERAHDKPQHQHDRRVVQRQGRGDDDPCAQQLPHVMRQCAADRQDEPCRTHRQKIVQHPHHRKGQKSAAQREEARREAGHQKDEQRLEHIQHQCLPGPHKEQSVHDHDIGKPQLHARQKPRDDQRSLNEGKRHGQCK